MGNQQFSKEEIEEKLTSEIFRKTRKLAIGFMSCPFLLLIFIFVVKQDMPSTFDEAALLELMGPLEPICLGIALLIYMIAFIPTSMFINSGIWKRFMFEKMYKDTAAISQDKIERAIAFDRMIIASHWPVILVIPCAGAFVSALRIGAGDFSLVAILLKVVLPAGIGALYLRNYLFKDDCITRLHDVILPALDKY